MNKKILILSIFYVFMLLSISIVTAINIKDIDRDEVKISPLYKLRIKSAIAPREKLKNIFNNIKTKYLGENRVFYIPVYIDGDLSFKSIFKNLAFTNRYTSLFCCHLTYGRCTDDLFTCRPPHGCGPTAEFLCTSKCSL